MPTGLSLTGRRAARTINLTEANVIRQSCVRSPQGGQVTGATLPSPASRLSRVPRLGGSGGDRARLAWLNRATWSIRCMVDPQNNRIARINHLIQHANPSKGGKLPW